MEQIWQRYREVEIPIPDLVVITTCSPIKALSRMKADIQIVGTARKEQEHGSGLSGKVTVEQDVGDKERLGRQQLIHNQYELVMSFLKSKGVNVLRLNTESLTVADEINTVLSHLMN